MMKNNEILGTDEIKVSNFKFVEFSDQIKESLSCNMNIDDIFNQKNTFVISVTNSENKSFLVDVAVYDNLLIVRKHNTIESDSGYIEGARYLVIQPDMKHRFVIIATQSACMWHFDIAKFFLRSLLSIEVEDIDLEEEGIENAEGRYRKFFPGGGLININLCNKKDPRNQIYDWSDDFGHADRKFVIETIVSNGIYLKYGN